MSLWREVFCVELVGVNPLQTLYKANELGVAINQIQKKDDLTLCFEVHRRDYRKLAHFAKRRGCRLTIKRRDGAYRIFSQLLQRPVLLIGMIGIAVLTLYIPTRVLFVEVDGNEIVPDQMIIEAASRCGIDFGASRRMIRSEKVKNELLSSLPQLQWLGVNTYGCKAVISVQEKSVTDYTRKSPCISSVVAARDGVIHSMTVSSGTPLCRPGQAVQEGQLLVSGYSDCGICIHGTQSEADILADTQRHLQAVTPVNYVMRADTQEISKKYSVIIGKKQINFFKGSGISDTTCGKIYEINYLTLPGGFELPFAVACKTTTTAAVYEIRSSQEQSEEVLMKFSDDYLDQKMVAGEIVTSSYDLLRHGDVDCLSGTYMCREMIGRIRIEETVE